MDDPEAAGWPSNQLLQARRRPPAAETRMRLWEPPELQNVKIMWLVVCSDKQVPLWVILRHTWPLPGRPGWCVCRFPGCKWKDEDSKWVLHPGLTLFLLMHLYTVHSEPRLTLTLTLRPKANPNSNPSHSPTVGSWVGLVAATGDLGVKGEALIFTQGPIWWAFVGYMAVIF